MTRGSAHAPLPPGQVLTGKFPVVGEKIAPPGSQDLDAWRLEITGCVEAPLALTYAEFRALPQRERTVDIHCVTSWSQLGMTFTGVPLAELLDRARPTPAAHFVSFVACSERNHDTSLPLGLAHDDTWLVHSYNGAPLAPEHGFPLRTLTPSRYFYKSLKWVRRIELLAEDRLGYWERESAYHNVADPWPGNQRFTTGGLAPDKLALLRAGEDLDRWRGPHRVVIGVDLRGWDPRDRDLRELYLKNADLRDAQLAGVDLRGANLSLCDLRGAKLRGADARGADLEGVTFAGADLRDADLSGAFLSAARFTDDVGGNGARVEGMRWEGATGLVETQEAYLRGG